MGYYEDKGKKKWISSDKKGAVEGIFDIEEVCKTLVSSLETKGYDMEEKDRGQCNEAPNRELLTFYDGFRYIDDYYKLWIQYRIEMSGKDVEIEVDGKKKIMTQGKAEVIVSTSIQIDPYNKKGASKFAKFFIGLYDRYHQDAHFSDSILEASGDAGELIVVLKKVCGAKIF